MPFRSHITREIDIRSRSNLALIGLVLAAGAIALVLWLDGRPAQLIFFAPAFGFVTWALVREIDPDHHWTAMVAAAGASGWILVGGAQVSLFAMAILILVGRLVTESTGRRPLMTDLLALAVAVLAAFTVEGWIAGFGLAVALYLDDRFSDTPRAVQIWGSAGIAAGATIVATLTEAFPRSLPQLVPAMVIAAGIVALVLVIREPAEPITQVDARHKAFLDQGRVHTSRSLVAVLIFAMSLLTGVAAEGLVPVVFALVLAIVSNEIELIRRRDL